jgi:anthranilate synthase/aminodeoxychorismate synthase-like glutamine amidotransferase
MIAVIDNHDSFTGSLLQCLATLGAEFEVHGNRAVTVGDLAGRPLAGLLLTSGPGEPDDAGVTPEALRHFAGRLPLLGIGLGHQALAGSCGARLVPAPRLLHGATSPVLHRARGLFAGIENPFEAARYHARVVERESLPANLEVTAWTPEGEIMGLRHRDHESWGVQFPPQSILTRPGLRLVENFLTLCRQQKERPR